MIRLKKKIFSNKKLVQRSLQSQNNDLQDPIEWLPISPSRYISKVNSEIICQAICVAPQAKFFHSSLCYVLYLTLLDYGSNIMTLGSRFHRFSYISLLINKKCLRTLYLDLSNLSMRFFFRTESAAPESLHSLQY